MRETSLDEFLGSSEDEQSGTAAGEDDEPEDGERESAPDGTAESIERGGATDEADETADPATVTYAWTPEGAACADCGTAVERRWRADDRLVCVDCKEW